jgi:O-antigen/teichoic acid export membrane protein
MQRKFLPNLLLLVGVNLLIKPFWILGIDRTVQNTVGNIAYGAFTNLFAFSLLFSMLLDFGINNFASTQVARHPQLAGKHFSSLGGLKLIFSAAYLLVTWLAGMAYGFSAEALQLLMLLSFNQVMAFFILFIRSHVSGLQLFTTDAVLSVMDRGLMIVACGLLIWSGLFTVTISRFAVGQATGYGISLVICLAVLFRHTGVVRITFNKALMVSLVKQTWPYALLALLMIIYMRADVILLKKLRDNGDAENGIYAQSTRLLEAANMLAAMVSSMLLPLFARMLAGKEPLVSSIRLSITILIVPAIAVGCFGFVWSGEIMQLLYTAADEYSSRVFSLLIWAFTGYAMVYVFGTLLTAGGSLRLLCLIAAVCLFVNLVFNLWLIPTHGAWGSALTAVITQLLAGVLNMWFANSRHETGLTTTDLLRVPAFGIIFFLLCQLLHSQVQDILPAGVILVISAGVLLLAMRFQSIGSIARSMQDLLRKG